MKVNIIYGCLLAGGLNLLPEVVGLWDLVLRPSHRLQTRESPCLPAEGGER